MGPRENRSFLEAELQGALDLLEAYSGDDIRLLDRINVESRIQSIELALTELESRKAKEALVKLRESNQTVIYAHANCADGLASAIIAKAALINAEVVFVSHHKELVLDVRPALFVDFCPPAKQADDFLANGSVVLDHHRSAREVVSRFESINQGVFADEEKDRGVSGAMLVYQHVYMGENEIFQEMAHLIGLSDTYQINNARYLDGVKLSLALRTIPSSIWLNTKLNKESFELFKKIGAATYDNDQDDLKRLASKVIVIEEGNVKVAIIDSMKVTGILKLLPAGVDAIIGFHYDVDSDKQSVQLQLSVRSKSKERFHAANFCKLFGGGGHDHAAGCSLDVSYSTKNPYSQIQNVIKLYFAQE